MTWYTKLPLLFSTSGIGAASIATIHFLTTKSTADAPVPSHTPTNPRDDGDVLKLVQVVFRHGARTPLSSRYWPDLVEEWDVCGKLFNPIPIKIISEDGSERPRNSHNEKQIATKLKGGCHKGELTLEGQRQARSFGRWLRQRYMSPTSAAAASYISSEEYDAVHARTTNYSRTIATVQGVLTGLFPSFPSTPIPVHTTEEMDEILFGNPESCRKLKQIIKATAAHAKAESGLPPPEVKALQDYIIRALNLPPGEPVHFLDLHDSMTTMQTHGKEIPKALQKKEILSDIEQQATKRFLQFIAPQGIVESEVSEKDEVIRLGMGRLMQLMLQRMEEAADNKKGMAKIYLYSGHDSTIMPLLAALGKKVDHWPVYLSNIIFEVWEKKGNNGEHYVKVLYEKEPLDLEESCGGGQNATCTLRQLKESVLKPYLVSEKERQSECLVHFSHDLPAGENVKEIEVGSSISDDDA